MHRHYDLIAIGGGSGGLAVAERAARHGRRVAIVESRALGGTCVHAGCVPKKVMWYAAHLSHAVADAPDFGVKVRGGGTDWGRLVQGRDRYVGAIHEYWDGYAERLGADVIHGRARFRDARTVEVEGRRYTADHIVIATGGRPLVPAVPGAGLGITSDGFFALDAQPRRVAVIGGGSIGVELAGVLRALGSEVTLVALESRVLELFDPLIGETLSAEMARQGIDLHLPFRVQGLERGRDGLLVRGAEGVLEGFDQVIWAVGRTPATEDLQLAAAGVDRLPNGVVPADAFQNTNVPGIYALGDITGRAPLTPVAIAAGRRLADRLFGGQPEARLDYENVPTVVFAHPPAGSVGLSEPAAVERFGDGVRVYETRFVPMRYALNAQGMETAMKLVCAGPDERVVGVHLVGDGAEEILQGFAVAVQMGARKADLDRTVAIHPTSAEELVTLKEGRAAQPPSQAARAA
jgi:glutathione reductase (NADPH)